jgi:PAS domain S-box-containing protein
MAVPDPSTAEAQALLSAIVYSSDDAIVSKDLNGIVTSWNRAAERIFGYTAGEMIGQSIERLFPPDRLDEEPEILRRIRRGDRVDHFETIRRRKDGTLINVSVTISPVRDAAGTIVGASKVARDITESRRLQAELEARTAELERKNAELEEADRQKNQFIAMLAHELRNPLSPILTAVEVFRLRGVVDPILTKQVDVVARQVGQMKRLLDDLLDVSRLTRGKIRLERRRIDLTPILKHAVETSRPLIDERGHTLTVLLPPVPLEVDGDGVRLTQVVTNLLNNAARYTPPGGSIWLKAERVEATALVSVRDTGIGMTPDVLACAFEMFSQGERTLARSEGGLGIGLALVREIVELHGGTVSARSPGLDRGSEFEVLLPLAAASIHAGPPETENASPDPQPLPGPAGDCTVLVVDDDSDQTLGLALLLESRGYAVCTARDAPAAVAAAREHRPQIAILDIGLPGVDGYALARQLRAHSELGPLTLIAVTGFGREDDQRAASDAGFDHHFTKPVSPSELLRVMAEAGTP